MEGRDKDKILGNAQLKMEGRNEEQETGKSRL